ncbi:MAG TPA: hypothetical protein PKK12_04420 [Candidatus Aminicenantes bacterium]|nr:hypothetical protein [Candidatus Aminicenantes bacterium]
MMARVISNLGRVFQQIIYKALRINHIEQSELYMMGWAIVLVDLVTSAVMLSRKHYGESAIYLAFALVAGPTLVYIGRKVGSLKPPQRELVDVRISLDNSSTLLLAGLLRQSLRFQGEGAIILTEQGEVTVRAIADNIESQATAHLLAKQGGTR